MKTQHFLIPQRNGQIRTMAHLAQIDAPSQYQVPVNSYSSQLPLYRITKTVPITGRMISECNYMIETFSRDIPVLEKISSTQQNVIQQQSSQIQELTKQLSPIGWNDAIPWQRGSGIRNIGQTCYAAAILQALFHIPPLVEWMLTRSQHILQCQGQQCTQSTVCEMVKLLLAVRANAVGDPTDFMNLFRTCTTQIINNTPIVKFPASQQHDAHEFLVSLTNLLDTELKDNSPFPAVFQFGLKHAIKCPSPNCRNTLSTLHCQRAVELHIDENARLNDLITSYFKDETVSGFQCSNCKMKLDSIKSTRMIEPPIILTILLKRFNIRYEYEIVNGKREQKVITRKKYYQINIPKILRIKSFDPEQENNYELVALVNHKGTLSAGHYTTIVRSPTAAWVEYNDHNSTILDPTFTINPALAYILLYRLVRFVVYNFKYIFCILS